MSYYQVSLRLLLKSAPNSYSPAFLSCLLPTLSSYVLLPSCFTTLPIVRCPSTKALLRFSHGAISSFLPPHSSLFTPFTHYFYVLLLIRVSFHHPGIHPLTLWHWTMLNEKGHHQDDTILWSHFLTTSIGSGGDCSTGLQHGIWSPQLLSHKEGWVNEHGLQSSGAY